MGNYIILYTIPETTHSSVCLCILVCGVYIIVYIFVFRIFLIYIFPEKNHVCIINWI